jgi:oxygen-dependent protoporphyrinogen oxidase
MRLAVVGGGIAGLAAAWEARERATVTVFEPGAVGGKLRTADFEGRPIDCSADAFLTRVPDALALTREIGLGDDLVAPAAGQALVWRAGAGHPLPADLVLGAPKRLGPLVRSRLLGPRGVARAGLDLVLPATPWPDDVSVYELIRRRFGHEVASRLVDPLVGSIHAGRTDELSAAATVPQLLVAARRSRSLMLGLRHPPASAPPVASGPVFLAPRQGMQAIADRLADRLRQAGVTFVAAPVTRLTALPSGRVGLETSGPGEVFDGVVLATPAATAATILGESSPPELAAIPTASVALVTLQYATTDLRLPPGVSGVLVAREEGMLMTACSYADTKWPHWSSPGRVLLRVSTGRHGDLRHRRLDDATLVSRLAGELRLVAGATGEPLSWRVSRWADAFPQYRVGHLSTVARIEATLRTASPGVRLAGSSYRGAGVPACIASGRRAAAALLDAG